MKTGSARKVSLSPGKWPVLILMLFTIMLYSRGDSFAQNIHQLVRLAIIEIDSAQLNSYYTFLKEEIEASIGIEPGVLTLYAVSEKANPTHVTIFETYADSIAYKSHLLTPHFQKYKTGTAKMVRNLTLIETSPILYSRKPGIPSSRNKSLFVRLVKLEIEPSQLDHYKAIVKQEMELSIPADSGVLTMYAVSEKETPNHVSVLEIYADFAAYQAHLKAPYFIKYKDKTKDLVNAMQLIEAEPIFLGAKAH